MTAITGPVNYDPTDPDKMRLPAGAKCGDCQSIYRCKSIFGHVETDTHCDWSPSRFWPARDAAEIGAAIGGAKP